MDDKKKNIWIEGFLVLGSFAFAGAVGCLSTPYVNMIFDKLTFLEQEIVLVMVLVVLGYVIFKGDEKWNYSLL